MTLYQINRKAAPRWSVLEEQVRRLVISNVLVPVEPCEHGKIDGHRHPLVWCSGAGLGGDYDE